MCRTGIALQDARVLAGLLEAPWSSKEHPERVKIPDSGAAKVAHAIPAIRTAGRYLVTGKDIVHDRPQTSRPFMQYGQSRSCSTLPRVGSPPWAEASVPWRIEQLLYRPELATGPRMLRALRNLGADDASASIWPECIITNKNLGTSPDPPEPSTCLIALGQRADA